MTENRDNVLGVEVMTEVKNIYGQADGSSVTLVKPSLKRMSEGCLKRRKRHSLEESMREQHRL